MALHTPTLFLVIIVASLMLAAAIAFIAYRRHHNLFLWASALAMQGLAYGLISLRGQVSDLLSIVLGNVALSATFALLGEGVFRFQDRPPPRWLLWLPVAVVAVGFAMLIDTLFPRLLLGGLVYSLQCTGVLVALLQRRRQTPGRGQYILAAGTLAVLGVMGFRVVAIATGQARIGSFDESSPLQAYTFLAAVIGTLWLSVGLVMMNQERAEQALKDGRALERFRSRVLELLSTGEGLRPVLTAIVTGIEQLHPGMLCSVLLLDREGRHLGDGVAPSLPDFFNAAVDGLAIGVGVGACGTAAFTGQRVVVEKIAEHPSWAAYRDVAARAGLAACWSQPILSSDNKVLGSFAIYHRVPHTPTAAHIALIEQSARLASIAVERHREAAELQRSEERYRRLVDSADEGIAVAQDGLLRLVNPKLYSLLGRSQDELIGRSFLEFIHPDDHERVLLNYQRRLQGQHDGHKYPLRLLTLHQGIRWFEVSGTRFDWDGRPATLNFLTDITDRRQMEQRVRQMAYHDALTQLPNRNLLTDRLHLAIAHHKRSGRRGALMFMDLDNFKQLNDSQGHDLGDLLLIEVARRLNHQVRESDTVARFGGDEFVVMLGELADDEATASAMAWRVAEKIRSALAEPYLLLKHLPTGGHTIVEHRCSASIGLLLFGGDSGSEETLLQRADAAMYQAKQAGRNTVSLYQPTA